MRAKARDDAARRARGRGRGGLHGVHGRPKRRDACADRRRCRRRSPLVPTRSPSWRERVRAQLTSSVAGDAEAAIELAEAASRVARRLAELNLPAKLRIVRRGHVSGKTAACGLAGAADYVLEAAGDRKTAAGDADVREQTAAEEIHEVGHTWIIAAETIGSSMPEAVVRRPVHKVEPGLTRATSSCGTGIRTPTSGSRDRRPTVRRSRNGRQNCSRGTGAPPGGQAARPAGSEPRRDRRHSSTS